MSDTAKVLDEAASARADAAIVTELLKKRKQKAGHQEILGETLAKFEFFQHGWHPYTRFLDVDKVDLVLRRRCGHFVEYRDIQVKFGKLYNIEMAKWEKSLFATTSWRFFTIKELHELENRNELYLAYVLSKDDRYQGDIFIFPVQKFVAAVKQSVKSGDDRYKLYISRELL